MAMKVVVVLLLLGFVSVRGTSFTSDELPEDDEEWGIVGGSHRNGERDSPRSAVVEGKRVDLGASAPLDALGDKKIQFTLEHSFAGSEFAAGGTFSARVRSSSHGRQSLSKLRLTRNTFSESDKAAFKALVRDDGFYSVRISADVLNPGKVFVMASVKARCLAAANLKERFDLHLDQGSVIGITYSAAGDCPYPRPQVAPSDWSFDSWIVTKTSEQALRMIFLNEEVSTVDGDKLGEGEEGAPKKIIEKTFWQKYWMYIVPLGLIVVNAITQVANMPEETTAAPGGAAQAAGAPQRIAGSGGSRRR